MLRILKRAGMFSLVVSRASIVLPPGIEAKSFLVETLEKGIAAQLLQDLASPQPCSPEIASALADICGCNPLAVSIVGGFINAQHCTAEVGPSHGPLANFVCLRFL